MLGDTFPLPDTTVTASTQANALARGRWRRRKNQDVDTSVFEENKPPLPLFRFPGTRFLFFRLVVDGLEVEADVDVSVFETNIRLLGGLLSAHLLASDPDLGLYSLPNLGERRHEVRTVGPSELPIDWLTERQIGSRRGGKGRRVGSSLLSLPAGAFHALLSSFQTCLVFSSFCTYGRTFSGPSVFRVLVGASSGPALSVQVGLIKLLTS